MSIFNAAMLKPLLPILEKTLTDEKVSEAFDQLADSFPLEDGETRNVIVLSKTKNTVNFSVCGFRAADTLYIIGKPKIQTSLVDGIKMLLTKFLK